MVDIPRDFVELDCREEGKVNLPEIHVTCYARGDWMELREAKLLQIIREMFGGMENCLYLCSVDKNNIIMNASVVNSIREYFKTKPVEKAWVFGSFSRNEEREDSDIDIMVELSPDARMGLSYFAMICDLEDRLNRRVDMVREGQLLPFAIESANRDKILVYERNR